MHLVQYAIWNDDIIITIWLRSNYWEGEICGITVVNFIH